MSFKRLPCFLILIISAMTQAQITSVMTYNIKYDNVNDTVNNWNDRKVAMVGLLKKYHPSFIGLQEALFNQLTYLVEALPDYRTIGVGREDGKQKGEFSPILYDTKMYDLVQGNTFWLSKTPEKISVGWDAALERICTYGLFEDKQTKKKLWVFNTHFDHIGVLARTESAQLILKKIKEINAENYPVVLMGDFNLTPEKEPIRLIKKVLKDGLDISKTPFQGPKGSFNDFNSEAPIERRIDYIFVNEFSVERYVHIDERMANGKHISDHLPVLAVIK
ncbi:MAG: endonuclease/exonuclease/phosphatase family protein [Maribacter sp.]|nr:endonuclease/exonuclease/phosphatase family protein [Maribacter sp.]